MANLCERLKLIRKERNIRQLDVVNNCEISLRSYKYYEAGEHKPDSDVLIKLADYFDVSIDYLVGRTDDPNSHKPK